MKLVTGLIVIFAMSSGFAKDFPFEEYQRQNYAQLGIGIFNITPAFGTGTAFLFSTQVLKKSSIGIGINLSQASFKSNNRDSYARIGDFFIKYYLDENISLGFNFGAAMLTLNQGTAFQQSTYGAYGAHLEYDIHNRGEFFGYSISLQNLSVVNNPSMNWMGAKASIKFWY